MQQKIILPKKTVKKVDSYINSLKFPNVKVVKDIRLTEEGQKIDVYLPKNPEGKMGVFVNFHGGFFKDGNKNARHGFCSYLADKGIATVNVGYGRFPKYYFPDQLRHASLALKWVEENANQMGFDLDKVAVGGDGIGGYIACQAIVANTNPEYRDKLDVVGVNYRIRGGVFFRSIFDMDLVISIANKARREGKTIGRLLMGKGKESIESSKYYEYISPIKFVNEAFPDTFIAFSTEDRMRAEQAARLINILNRFGIPKWEFRSIFGSFVREGRDEKEYPKEVMYCIEDSARFLLTIFNGTIKEDKCIEI